MKNLNSLLSSVNTIGSAISGSNGFYYSESDPDVYYPYIVWHIIDDSYSRLDTNTKEDNVLLQFNLFDRRKTESGNLIAPDLLNNVVQETITKFESTNIAVSGSTNIDFIRIFTTPPEVVDGGLYWQAILRFEVIFNT